MKITRPAWTIFLILSLISIIVWYKFSYPQMAFVNLSVDRNKALTIAKNYLQERGENPERFDTAIIFTREGQANRYLQKTIGFDKFQEFISEHDFDLFFWIVRFFKEGEKEGYRLTVSSSTGQVTSFKHALPHNTQKEDITRDEAQTTVESFLNKSFGFNPDDYELKRDIQNKYDKRVDYSFSWKKKDVDIPWSDEPDTGTGKIVTGATISGDEIISFSKNTFHVPGQFNRNLASKKEVGNNITTIVAIFYRILFIASVFFIFVRRNHLAMHSTKKFYIGVMLISFGLSLASIANNYESILFKYKTTSSFDTFLARHLIQSFIGALFVTVAVLMPSLSGELMRFEVAKDNKRGSFLHYVQTTFFSRDFAQSIMLGYFVWIIMVGLQSLLFEFGQQHLGVWIEYSFKGQLSTAYLPFLAALTVGYKASFMEETMFRLFAINWGKKLFKNTFVAVIVASMIWGFAHSSYPVFPMWFRGIEVTLLGIFLSFIYLKYGLVCVIVAHFLFDAFWASSGYILGEAQPAYFYSAWAVLLFPLFIAVIAFIINKPVVEKPLRWHLNKHQLYNLEVLKYYLNSHMDEFKGKTKEETIKEIASHGWDIAVVEVALEDYKN